MMYYAFYPSYDELDYIKNKYVSKGRRVNFFFDVKNGLSGDTARADGQVVSLLSQANKGEHLMEFITSIMNLHAYIINRMEADPSNIRFHFFCETGKSNYHKAIDMLYKSNRHLSDYLIRDEHDPLKTEIVFNALEILENVINRFPNHYFYYGRFAEFDYIPYIIMSQYAEDKDIGILYSTDKDMYQIQSYIPDRLEQLEKLPALRSDKVQWHPGRMFIESSNYMERFMYSKCKAMPETFMSQEQIDFFKNHWSLMRAIVGDPGDNVTGIAGIGYKVLVGLLKDLMPVTRPREEYNDMIARMRFNMFDYRNRVSIFDIEAIQKTYKSKKLSSILNPSSVERICRNIGLMDYEVMRRRRWGTDKPAIEKVLFNEKKFESIEQGYTFLKNAGLIDRYPDMPVRLNFMG